MSETIFDKIIALSVLPILFIAFGIDELSKIMLIVIGVTPTVILDAFNLTFIEKLATYGLRRTMSFSDRDELKVIAAASKAKDYRLRDIVEAFVCSELFQRR